MHDLFLYRRAPWPNACAALYLWQFSNLLRTFDTHGGILANPIHREARQKARQNGEVRIMASPLVQKQKKIDVQVPCTYVAIQGPLTPNPGL